MDSSDNSIGVYLCVQHRIGDWILKRFLLDCLKKVTASFNYIGLYVRILVDKDCKVSFINLLILFKHYNVFNIV